MGTVWTTAARTFHPEVETALCRIAREGLNNVLKHAGATRTSLVLERGGRLPTLILEDDGSGFDVEQTLARLDKANRLGAEPQPHRRGEAASRPIHPSFCR